MWEIPFYAIFVPILTIIISLFCAFKLRKFLIAPLIIFSSLNILTVTLPIFYNVDWKGLFGWAVFYSIVSGIISIISLIVGKLRS